MPKIFFDFRQYHQGFTNATGVDKDGYYKVELSKDGKRTTHKIHRLVAREFIENPERKTRVDTIVHNRSNNQVTN